MAGIRRRTLLAGVLSGVVAAGVVSPARACGPYLPEALFTYELHPDLPLADFAAGTLGIIQPTYARSYLYVAYHQMHGGNFDADARRALAALWDERLGRAPATAAPTAVEVWQKARAAVVGEGDPLAIDTMREIAGEVYQYYANCLDDAFLTAARTLEARAARAGRDDPSVRAWVAAQDQVFQNCNGTTAVIPAPLPESATPAARADRAYQIAAAELYAGRFDAAAAGFRAIAADATSPWAPLGGYLAARAQIRKASLAVPRAGADRALSKVAVEQLDAVVADQRAAALHASARGLRDLVRFRSAPEALVRTLAAELLAPAQTAAVAPKLVAFTWLLDRRLDSAPEGEPTGAIAGAARDQLSDWMFTFQADDAQARDHALHTWEETHAPVWLLAAISKAAPGHARADAMIAETDGLDPSHPGFVTIAAHAARLEIGRSELAKARTRLDALLARRDLPRGTVNRLRALRMAAAENAGELARFAVRTPLGVSYGFDGNELPDEVTDDPLLQAYAAGRPAFDADAAWILNRRLPLAAWLALANHAALDAELQRRIAIAGWVRAVLLDHETAPAFAARAGALAPDLEASLVAVTEAPAAEHRFGAILFLLRRPGLGPFVRAGLGRTTPAGDLDAFRDNWWCDAANAGIARPEWYPDVAPVFLTPAERKKADDEWARLAKLPSAPTALAAEAVAYGRAHPEDGRVAEALHLAVRATRFGCTDARTSAQSKAAYQLLHRRYPKSEWAAKTKYYF
jgi:hypothetical protein